MGLTGGGLRDWVPSAARVMDTNPAQRALCQDGTLGSGSSPSRSARRKALGMIPGTTGAPGFKKKPCKRLGHGARLHQQTGPIWVSPAEG